MDAPRPLTRNRLTAPLGTHNALLSARARTHFVKDFAGPLSIKSVAEGTVAWKTGGRELVVDRDSFLILNHREPYSMEIDSRTPVSTLCVFFQDEFVESVHASLVQDDIDSEPAPARFPGYLHVRDSRILPRLQAINQRSDAAGEPARLWLDHQYLELARDLLLLGRDVNRRVRLLPARRPATREELFRRVRRGQEILHADPTRDWGLAEIARASCLSPYHFQRAFTCAFGKSPHQYRNHLRLARARRLLESTSMTVTEICGAVGFESAPSFTTLYRQSFGEPPSVTRKLSNSR
jgi:AraC family transcriptional regulator